jgi:hypothetical protein
VSEGVVGRDGHLSAKGINFSSNVPFCGTAYAAVAREMTDSVGAESHAQSVDADSRGGESGFNSGVSGTDHNDVKVLHCTAIVTVCDFYPLTSLLTA